MLHIHAAQFEVFEERVFILRYETTMVAYLRQHHGTAIFDLSNAKLLEQLRRWAARARLHGASDAIAWARA